MFAEEVIFIMLPAEWCVERNNQKMKMYKRILKPLCPESLLYLPQTQQTQNKLSMTFT